MRDLIEIQIYSENRLIAVCNNMTLAPIAKGFVRDISFNNIRFLVDKMDIMDNVYYRKLEISVVINSLYFDPIEYTAFEFHIFESDNAINASWNIVGVIIIDLKKIMGYFWQPTIDIINSWQLGESCRQNWFQENTTIEFKLAYIDACFYVSGIHSKIIEKAIYTIDWSHIRDEEDFIFFVSEEFFGEQGYMGRDMYTFSDCLSIIKEESAISYNEKTIILKSIASINQPKVNDIYMESLEIFKRNGFVVVVYQ